MSPITLSGIAAGYFSNAGAQRYLLEAESTTGYVAWRLADGTTLVSAASQVTLPTSPAISFWACAGHQDPTPTGGVISLDVHGNLLTQVNVTALNALKYLDVSFNGLRSLALNGLAAMAEASLPNYVRLVAMEQNGIRLMARVVVAAAVAMPVVVALERIPPAVAFMVVVAAVVRAGLVPKASS